MNVLLVLAACASACIRVEGVVAPFIIPCHASDTKCLKSSAQKAVPILAAGIPTIGLHPLDPMQVGHITSDQAGLKIEFRDSIVKGLRHCDVLSLKIHGKKHNLELKCNITLVGNYTIGGRLLILKVEGDGRYKIKITDIVVKVIYEVDEKEMDGEKYWSLTTWKHAVDVKTGVEFQFQNLFNGNKQLADPVLKFANENWPDIFKEVAPPIIKAIVAKVVKEAARFFDKVPIKELSLD